MGKIEKPVSAELTFTKLQRAIFEEFANDQELTQKFYFTGGTALSAVYLHHRESEDLDFFTETDFDTMSADRFIENIAKKQKTEFRFTQIEQTRIYQLFRSGKLIIKIDFGHYPYQRLEKGPEIKGVKIDSLKDIGTNKLQTITSRTEVKDFVDFYFLLKEFTLWDLIYAVRKKFNLEIDLVWLASDFLKVENFDYLPKMLIPLSLPELKDFYMELAKKLGMRVVQK